MAQVEVVGREVEEFDSPIVLECISAQIVRLTLTESLLKNQEREPTFSSSIGNSW